MIRQISPVGLLLLLCVTTFGLQGCAKPGPSQYSVSGKVTLDGQPLSEGTVYLKVIETGALVTLPVKNGTFQGKSTEGNWRVEVVAYRITPIPGDRMGSETAELLIAPRFNSQSTLTAVVTPAGPNEFVFEVTSK
ncbi:hypothetical protein [Anatilimnocola aggregata]|nr:hypothetical protein [Anatilimnocola aggregata]